MEDILELHDPEIQPWMESQLPSLHLLAGDSVARGGGLQPTNPRDRVFSQAVGGATWASLDRELPDIIRRWTAEAERQGRRRGGAIVWLSGNDVYSRLSGLQSFTEEKLDNIAEKAQRVVARLLEETDDVTILGPLPRPSADLIDLRWEDSGSYQLDRALYHRLPRSATLVPLGRQLTQKDQKKHVLKRSCLTWFRQDRTHLSPAGYKKLAKARSWPSWLQLRPGH